MGSHAGILRWSQYGVLRLVNHFIELLNIFHIKMPLWLAYDHWTGCGLPRTWWLARWRKPRMPPRARDTGLPHKVTGIMGAQPPELVQRAMTC